MLLLSGGICGLLVLALMPLQSRADEDQAIKKICAENLCSSTEGCPLAKNALLTTLPVLNKEFSISFEFRATAWQSGWQNVIHLTEGGNCCNAGRRVPGFWVKDSGQLHPCFAIGDNGNYCTLTTKEYSLNTWHKVEISQSLKNGKYMYRVVVDGEDIVAPLENTKPRAFFDLKVFAADSWYNPLEGSIRNLNTGCGGLEIFKNDYLALKNDGSHEYKKEVQTRLPRLLERGVLKEGEVGVAFSVTDPKERYPFGLLTEEGFITNRIPKQSIAINGTVNQRILKRGFGNLWRPTGLYAPPGEFITVTIPEELVDKISVVIDHSDYFIGSKMKKTTLKVGSPWGGLILFYLNDWDATTKLGQFNVEIQNGVQAPYWVYGEDTNEKWNKIKNNASPWTILRIPGQLAVYIQTMHVKPETDMEKVMKGWKETMDLLDDMMGIPVGIQPGEEQLHYHPYVGGGLRMGTCTGAGRSAIGESGYRKFLTNNCETVFHEFGHGYCYGDLPGGESRGGGMGGQWTAELIREYIERTKPGLPPLPKNMKKYQFNILYRMVSFKKFSKGKSCGEVKFPNTKSSYWSDQWDNCWVYLYRLPLWEWGWDKLRAVLSADARLTKHYKTKPERLADIYCNVTKHNLMPLFKFYNIKISDSIVKRCEQLKELKEPSLIMDWINIANCIVTKDITECTNLPDFPSYEGICTINGVCKSSPDHEGEQRTMKNEFDLWGATTLRRYKPGAQNTSNNEKNCLKRAAEVHNWCGNDQSQLVTATFTPKDGTPKTANNIIKDNCYYDNPRLLPKYIGSRANMVPEVCNTMCREAEDPDTLEKYSYFGVQYYNECWCGHKAPPLSRKLDPEDCDTMCQGDEKLRCGGGFKANIWKVCTDENCEFKYD